MTDYTFVAINNMSDTINPLNHDEFLPNKLKRAYCGRVRRMRLGRDVFEALSWIRPEFVGLPSDLFVLDTALPKNNVCVVLDYQRFAVSEHVQ